MNRISEAAALFTVLTAVNACVDEPRVLNDFDNVDATMGSVADITNNVSMAVDIGYIDVISRDAAHDIPSVIDAATVDAVSDAILAIDVRENDSWNVKPDFADAAPTPADATNDVYMPDALLTPDITRDAALLRHPCDVFGGQWRDILVASYEFSPNFLGTVLVGPQPGDIIDLAFFLILKIVNAFAMCKRQLIHKILS